MKPETTRRSTSSASFLAVMLLAAFVSVLGAGCQSGKPHSASFASVTIAHRTPHEIQQTTAMVFATEGYVAKMSPEGNLVLEREGTRMNQIAHGGIVEDAPALQRVRTELVPMPDGTIRLQCKAYIVRHANDPFFAEEIRLANFRSGPYQKLLDQVAERLK